MSGRPGDAGEAGREGRGMRLDQALVAAGLAASRARAQPLIAAGAVLLNGAQAARPGRACRRARGSS